MRLRSLPLLLGLLVALPGCDTSTDLVLDADFYVGTWDLVGVSDDSGDRSAQVISLLDEFAVAFTAARGVRLDADFTPVVNDLGQPDVTLEGTYQAQSQTQVLVLLIDGLAPSFQADAASEARVALTAPEAIVEQLLGAVQIEFQGDVTITLARR